MLRFPPTSIGLSESDIDFHLREVQIREHLYAQGFTRQDVQRYYNQRYGHGNGLDDDHVLPTRTPSVTLAKTREDPTQGSEEVCGPSGRPNEKPDMHSSHRSLQRLFHIEQHHLARMSKAYRNHHPPLQILTHPLRCLCLLHRL